VHIIILSDEMKMLLATSNQRRTMVWYQL
jgi:hypothetical protein